MDKETYAVDFETNYKKTGDWSIGYGGTQVYLNHEFFDPYLVSIVGPGIEYVGPVTEAPFEKIDGKEWVSHNNDFDQQVYMYCLEKQLVRSSTGAAIRPGPKEWHTMILIMSPVILRSSQILPLALSRGVLSIATP